MHRRSGKSELPVYIIRLLRQTDLDDLSRWIRSIYPFADGVRRILLYQLAQHPGSWNSSWIRTWVMEVNGQPAFSFSLIRDTAGIEDLPEGVSGMRDWVSLLAAPSIRTNRRMLMLAWQAAVNHIFYESSVPQVAVAAPSSETDEIVALERIGFHKIGETSNGNYLYSCQRDGLTPVF